MSILVVRRCPRCGIEANGNVNRLITDSCGHCKCRQCFLLDEECWECSQRTSAPAPPSQATPAMKTSKTPHEIVKPMPTSDNNKKRRKCNKIRSTPEHIECLQTDTGTFRYHCKPCGKYISQQYYHLSCGNKELKKHKCEQCDETFSKLSLLKYHLHSHDANTYSCDQCKKTFKNQLVWKRHLRLHNLMAIKCEECGKSFRSKAPLEAHILTHHQNTEPLPFQCNVCDKSYALKNRLKQHMLKHSEKRYMCPHCNKQFQRNTTLRFHLKQHSKTDTFLCMICYRQFSGAGVLMRHAKLHEETSKYRCMQCDTITIRKDNMLRHIRNMHFSASFESCVEIIKPNIGTLPEGNVIEPTNKLEIFEIWEESPSSNEPKTVENSSVIKCVGNVEPMKIPNSTMDDEFLEIVDKVFQTEDPPPSLTTLENVQENVDCSSATVSQKKVKKKYDPIEMYRKILTSDCEDLNDNENSDVAIEDHVEQAVAVVPTLEKRTNLNTSNFSEMHWRKNLTYTYEYQE